MPARMEWLMLARSTKNSAMGNVTPDKPIGAACSFNAATSAAENGVSTLRKTSAQSAQLKAPTVRSGNHRRPPEARPECFSDETAANAATRSGICKQIVPAFRVREQFTFLWCYAPRLLLSGWPVHFLSRMCLRGEPSHHIRHF